MDPYLKIKLHNWRCFQNTCFELPKEHFFIIDQNGTGKTSILSAIYTLTTKQAWSGTKLIDNLSFQQNYFGISSQHPFWYISGEVSSTGRLRTKQEIPDKTEWNKYFKIRQKPKIFTYKPTDNYWLYQSRGQKLKIIDQFLSQVDEGKYYSSLNKLNKSISEKNKLIKKAQETNTVDQTLLKLINQNIFENSNYIWTERNQFFEYLQTRITQLPKYLNTQAKNLELNWKKNRHNELKYFQTLGQMEIVEVDFLKLWHKEILIGRNMWGASRDEFDFMFDTQNITNIFSQGEMRMFTLFFKQICIDYCKLYKNYPIWILLDDVMAELDQTRQEVLFQKIYTQADWIIGTGVKPVQTNLKSYAIQSLESD